MIRQSARFVKPEAKKTRVRLRYVCRDSVLYQTVIRILHQHNLSFAHVCFSDKSYTDILQERLVLRVVYSALYVLSLLVAMHDVSQNIFHREPSWIAEEKVIHAFDIHEQD